MKGALYFQRFCGVMALMMLLACGGGGDGGGSTPPAPNISLASSIAFGGSLVNNLSGRTFEITNTGNRDLVIGAVSKPALPFDIPDTTDFCSGRTLAPSQTCALTVQFTPWGQSAFSGAFSIPSNDPDSPTVNIALTGTGYGLNVWINGVDNAACPAVRVEVTVTDPANVPGNNIALRGLAPGNFTLRQNGQAINAFNLLPITYPAPVSLVLALDSSVSLDLVQADIKTAAKSLIDQLDGQDEAAICKFFNEIAFYPAATSTPLFVTTTDTPDGKPLLNDYIDASFGGGFTALYDAVYQSIERATWGSAGHHKAVVVISDGVDEKDPPSVRTLDQVILYAQQSGVTVFTIYIVDPAYGGGTYGNTQVMQRLASETGGQFYYSDTANLQEISEQISNVLNNKYTITYASPSPTCSGTLDVGVLWNSLSGQDSISMP